MKKKNTVLILGVTSILILISVQVFIIVGVWKQKNETFSLRYTIRSQEAINYIRRNNSSLGLDTVRVLLNNYADKSILELRQITDPKELETKKREILENFTFIVNKEQDLSGLLSSYFEMRSLDKNFNYSIVINNLEYLNGDTIKIYQSESFAIRRASDRARRILPTEVPGSKIFITWLWLEGNHYRLNFDFYIDYADKQKVILQEMSGSLGLTTLSILLVGIMFMITYRNLEEERRLSNPLNL